LRQDPGLLCTDSIHGESEDNSQESASQSRCRYHVEFLHWRHVQSGADLRA
jgi:hypothetical protein